MHYHATCAYVCVPECGISLCDYLCWVRYIWMWRVWQRLSRCSLIIIPSWSSYRTWEDFIFQPPLQYSWVIRLGPGQWNWKELMCTSYFQSSHYCNIDWTVIFEPDLVNGLLDMPLPIFKEPQLPYRQPHFITIDKIHCPGLQLPGV